MRITISNDYTLIITPVYY